MQKGLGIAALVIAIVSIFIPILGPWVTIISGIMAAFAYGPGFALGLSSIIINLINIFILSPTVWLAMGVNAFAASQGKSFMSVGTILLTVQVIAAVILFFFNSKKKVQ